MASIFRREYKNKLSEAGIDEACRVITNASQWRTTIPLLVEKANNERADIRLAALQSMNEILTDKYIGKELDEYKIDFFDAIMKLIIDPISKPEHDEALGVMCNLALSLADGFEDQTNEFIDEIMPTISATTAQNSFRLFTVAFTAGMSITNNETLERILCAFIDLLLNKKQRKVEFESETIAELINGCAFLLSVLPEETFTESLEQDLERAIDIAFSSQKVDVLLASLNVLPVVYECMENSGIPVSRFVEKYKSKVMSINGKLDRKTDQKLVSSKAQQIRDIIVNGKMSETIVVEEQDVDLDGAKTLTIIAALRRITKHHFLAVLSQNTRIHQSLGIELEATNVVLMQKKKDKKNTVRERVLSTKDREMKLANQRRIKERKSMNDDEF